MWTVKHSGKSWGKHVPRSLVRKRALNTPVPHFPGAPAIILVEPQLGENIGMAARAMVNCGLGDLRLVNPRKGWRNAHTFTSAAGAHALVEAIKVYDSLAEAIADLHMVFATTARPRDMEKPTCTPHEFAEKAHDIFSESNSKVGILYGRERTGLENDDVSLADWIIQVPLNPDYSSLNLAQAVLLVGYEWFQKAIAPTQVLEKTKRSSPPAQKNQLLEFLNRLETELDKGGFFREKNIRARMIRNIKNTFIRAEMTEQEVRTFHGIITSLTELRRTPHS